MGELGDGGSPRVDSDAWAIPGTISVLTLTGERSSGARASPAADIADHLRQDHRIRLFRHEMADIDELRDAGPGKSFLPACEKGVLEQPILRSPEKVCRFVREPIPTIPQLVEPVARAVELPGEDPRRLPSGRVRERAEVMPVQLTGERRSAWSFGRYGASSGLSERPKPRWSGATTRWSRARSRIRCRKRKDQVGVPWTISTSGPSPSST